MAAGFRSFVQLILRGVSSSFASAAPTVTPPLTVDRIDFRQTFTDRMAFDRTATDEVAFNRTITDSIDFWGPL
jgi:hypothetical protein